MAVFESICLIESLQSRLEGRIYYRVDVIQPDDREWD